MLSGNLASIGVGGIVSVVYSLFVGSLSPFLKPDVQRIEAGP